MLALTQHDGWTRQGRRKWQKSFNIWVTELPFRVCGSCFCLFIFLACCWISLSLSLSLFCFFLLQHSVLLQDSHFIFFRLSPGFLFLSATSCRTKTKNPQIILKNVKRFVGWKLVVTPTLRNLSHWCSIWSAVPQKVGRRRSYFGFQLKDAWLIFFFFFFCYQFATPVAYQLGWLIAFGFLTVFFAY